MARGPAYVEMAPRTGAISWPAEREVDNAWFRSATVSQKWKSWSLDWAVLFVSAAAAAFVQNVVAVAGGWLGSLRHGYCSGHGWYLTRQMCCLGESEDCSSWVAWPRAGSIFVDCFVSVVCASSIAFVVREVAPRAAGSGIPEITAYSAGFKVVDLLRPITLIVRAAGLGLVVATNMWLGHEAPLVSVAAITAGLMPCARSEAHRRDRVTAAAATGIAAAFRAPIGGLLFVLEIFDPSPAVMWQSFVAAAAAGIFLEVFNPTLTDSAYFHVAGDRVWHTIELLPFVILGALGGLWGSACIWVHGAIGRLARWPISTVAAAAAISALSGKVTKLTSIPHIQILTEAFAECRPGEQKIVCENGGNVLSLLWTVLTGAILTPLSFGLPLPSGILLPSIVVGALGGRLFGMATQKILEQLPLFLSTSFCPDVKEHCVTPGVYALVGAAAALTGVTRLTLSSVAILFEISGALSYIVPIMAGVLVSKWVADMLGTESIMAAWKDRVGLSRYVEGPLVDIKAAEIMKPTTSLAIYGVTPLGELKNTKYHGFPIVIDDRLMGYLPRRSLDDPEATEPAPIIGSQASLYRIVTIFRQLGVRVILFVENGRLAGLISRKDALSIAHETQAPRKASFH